jgi:hypothetical protein
MREPRNRVVQVRRFGGPDELEVVDAPLPTAGTLSRSCSTSAGEETKTRTDFILGRRS